MHSGKLVRKQFSSLQSFWPGMQAALGDVDAATKSLNSFYDVLGQYTFLPEDFDVASWTPVRGSNHASFPLRPELVESTYFVHQVTNDSSWLDAGRLFLDNLNAHAKTACGYASIKNVETKHTFDDMPSFFLGETLKYLVLLFEGPNHFVRKGNFIFNTEAHYMRVTLDMHTKAQRLFVPSKMVDEQEASSTDDDEESKESPHNAPSLATNDRECPVVEASPNHAYDPLVPKYAISPTRSTTTRRDPVRPLAERLESEIAYSVGIKGLGDFSVTSSLGSAYRVTRNGTKERIEIVNLGTSIVHAVTTGCDPVSGGGDRHFFIENSKQTYECTFGVYDAETNVNRTVPCSFGSFGKSIEELAADGAAGTFSNLKLDILPDSGCAQKHYDGVYGKTSGSLVSATRGECTFSQKAEIAAANGVAALVVINHKRSDTTSSLEAGHGDSLFVMSGPATPTKARTAPTFLIPHGALDGVGPTALGSVHITLVTPPTKPPFALVATLPPNTKERRTSSIFDADDTCQAPQTLEAWALHVYCDADYGVVVTREGAAWKLTFQDSFQHPLQAVIVKA